MPDPAQCGQPTVHIDRDAELQADEFGIRVGEFLPPELVRGAEPIIPGGPGVGSRIVEQRVEEGAEHLPLPEVSAEDRAGELIHMSQVEFRDLRDRDGRRFRGQQDGRPRLRQLLGPIRRQGRGDLLGQPRIRGQEGPDGLARRPLPEGRGQRLAEIEAGLAHAATVVEPGTLVLDVEAEPLGGLPGTR